MSHDHICHYGIIRSLFSSPSSSHRGSQEKHTAEDAWLQRQRGGRRKEEAEVCQELEAAGNSVEGTYTGHVYLPVHPAAVLSPQLCLEAAPVLTGTDYSVPVTQNLGVQECEKDMSSCHNSQTVHYVVLEGRAYIISTTLRI